MFLKKQTCASTDSCWDKTERLKQEIRSTDAVLIGAGAGLSTSAGLTYSGERFYRYFSDFHEKYGINDIYSGGFYPYKTMEAYWAWWSRHIWVNRYMKAPKPVYDRLLEQVKDKDYFVITTNVDHCFQKAGFDKQRLFYTQGDYGLLQCSRPCHQDTYDNEKLVREMLEAQGFVIAEDGTLTVPDGVTLQMSVPTEMVPHCPKCGRLMTTNLRCDNTFAQDQGWYAASERYNDFLRRHKTGHVLYLELGVGANTPVIIKYPFWKMTARNKNAVYACLNFGEAGCPREIQRQAVCIDGDIGEILDELQY